MSPRTRRERESGSGGPAEARRFEVDGVKVARDRREGVKVIDTLLRAHGLPPSKILAEITPQELAGSDSMAHLSTGDRQEADYHLYQLGEEVNRHDPIGATSADRYRRRVGEVSDRVRNWLESSSNPQPSFGDLRRIDDELALIQVDGDDPLADARRTLINASVITAEKALVYEEVLELQTEAVLSGGEDEPRGLALSINNLRNLALRNGGKIGTVGAITATIAFGGFLIWGGAKSGDSNENEQVNQPQIGTVVATLTPDGTTLDPSYDDLLGGSLGSVGLPDGIAGSGGEVLPDPNAGVTDSGSVEIPATSSIAMVRSSALSPGQVIDIVDGLDTKKDGNFGVKIGEAPSNLDNEVGEVLGIFDPDNPSENGDSRWRVVDALTGGDPWKFNLVHPGQEFQFPLTDKVAQTIITEDLALVVNPPEAVSQPPDGSAQSPATLPDSGGEPAEEGEAPAGQTQSAEISGGGAADEEAAVSADRSAQAGETAVAEATTETREVGGGAGGNEDGGSLGSESADAGRTIEPGPHPSHRGDEFELECPDPAGDVSPESVDIINVRAGHDQAQTNRIFEITLNGSAGDENSILREGFAMGAAQVGSDGKATKLAFAMGASRSDEVEVLVAKVAEPVAIEQGGMPVTLGEILFKGNSEEFESHIDGTQNQFGVPLDVFGAVQEGDKEVYFTAAVDENGNLIVTPIDVACGVEVKPTPTPTLTPTPAPTETPTPQPTETPTATPTSTPEGTPSPSPTPEPTPVPSETATPTPTFKGLPPTGGEPRDINDKDFALGLLIYSGFGVTMAGAALMLNERYRWLDRTMYVLSRPVAYLRKRTGIDEEGDDETDEFGSHLLVQRIKEKKEKGGEDK